jgi:hypothetical protein
VLLLLVALFWQRFMARARLTDAALVFVCAAILALTWSLFHLAWLLAMALVLVLLRRREWRKVVAAAAVPVLVVALWYGKNLVLFGEFTGSTWFGMSLARMTDAALDRGERQALRESGAISPISFVTPFRAPQQYYGLVPKPPVSGIPVLDQDLKPSGEPNYNNLVYVAASRQYGRDAVAILRALPAAYIGSVMTSYLRTLRPAGASPFFGANSVHVTPLLRLEQFFDGRLGSGRRDGTQDYLAHCLSDAGWSIGAAYVFAFMVGLALLFRRARPSRSGSLFFLAASALWVVAAANAVEVGENDRFRFVSDPMAFALLVVAVNKARAAVLTNRAGATGRSAAPPATQSCASPG